jgi:serine/threonine protein kinase
MTQPIRDIFSAAIDIPSADERRKYLDEACGGDSVLRDEIEALVRAHLEAGSFLADDEEPQDPALDETVQRTRADDSAGNTVGPYKLLQQIGEGGMGSVWMAEQQQPVRRMVALKIIKAGMDSSQVIARFEAERQALALMNHPNIAKVLDAGTTDNGRPFFVMELVKGVRITEFCDKNKYPPAERLKLFIDVCRAVQHAHQKGIIHRDIKPSNVMVTLHDGVPVVKVIDFGLAKATSQKLTERTLFTAYGQMVGTPSYMSPEQAEMSGLDVDTRTDVYSLGVLLYELMTGTTPIDADSLRKAGFVEIQRLIQEQEAPPMSTRLSSLGASSSVIAGQRGSDADRLSQMLRGDLDVIVLKSLDKDRSRRYATPSDFADDVQRFLANETIEARPASAAYRLKKLYQRNRAAVLTSALVACVLVLATVFSSMQAIRASIAAKDLETEQAKTLTALEKAEAAEAEQRSLRREAEKARAQEEELRAEAENQKTRAVENLSLAHSAVDRFLNEVTEDELLTAPGLQPLRRKLLASALEFYEAFTKDHPQSYGMQVQLAQAYLRIALVRHQLGQDELERESLSRAIELFEQLRRDGADTIEVRSGLAQAYAGNFERPKAVNLCLEILEDQPEHAKTRSLLGSLYHELTLEAFRRANEKATLYYNQLSQLVFRDLVKEFPDNARYLAQLALAYQAEGGLHAKQGDHREALAAYQIAVNYGAEAYLKSPQRMDSGRFLQDGLRYLAASQRRLEMHAEGVTTLQRRVDVCRKLAFDNPAVASLKADLCQSWVELAQQQRLTSDPEAANRSFRAAREVMENLPRETASEMFELAVVYGELATHPSDSLRTSKGENEAERLQNENAAITWLKNAIEAGFSDASVLQSHRSLAVLKTRDEFEDLLRGLKTLREAESLVSDSDNSTSEVADMDRVTETLREQIKQNPQDVRSEKTLAEVLHSRGVAQIDLEEFDEAEKSLDEALEIRLRHLDEDRLQSSVDLVATQCRKGLLLWQTDRMPEAHRLWQAVLGDIDRLLNTVGDDSELASRLTDLSRLICDQYARLGLWDLAVAHTRSDVKRGSSGDFNFDVLHTSLLALTGMTTEYNESVKIADASLRQPMKNGQR